MHSLSSHQVLLWAIFAVIYAVTMFSLAYYVPICSNSQRAIALGFAKAGAWIVVSAAVALALGLLLR